MSGFNVDTTGNDVMQALGSQVTGKTGTLSNLTIKRCLLIIKVLITGPSKDGIGAEIAKTIAGGNPSQILLLGRNEEKIAPVIKEIQASSPGVKAIFIQCDLTDNSSVRKAAARVNSVVTKIDISINNAGVMAVRSFHLSADAVESQFAAGHLGHFLLTNLIMDKIVAGNGVVVNMTSSAYTLAEVDTQDPNFDVCVMSINPRPRRELMRLVGRAKLQSVECIWSNKDRQRSIHTWHRCSFW